MTRECPSGKKCFRTPQEAHGLLEMMRAKEHPAKGFRFETYFHQECGWFHNGHSKPRAPRRRGRYAKRPAA